MKEESTPLYGVNSLKRRVSIIEIELPDSTLSTLQPVRVHKTYASPSAHGRRFGSGKVTENLSKFIAPGRVFFKRDKASSIPHHYHLDLSVELLLGLVQPLAACRAAYCRLRLDVVAATYAPYRSAVIVAVIVIELRSAVSASDFVSRSHNCS